MKKALRWILVIGLLGGVAAGIWWYLSRQQAEASEVDVIRTGETSRGTLEISVAASGSATLERRVDLTFERPGTVREVGIEVGDRVDAGETLAKLDDDALVDAVRQAELDLDQAKLNLETALEPTDEDDIALAQLAIREASQAMKVAKLNEQYAMARAAVDQARAQELAKDAEQAYEDYIDILDDFGLPEAYAAPVTAYYLEAEGNLGITQLRSDYAIQQAQSQWQSAYQRYQQAERDLEQLKEGPDERQIERLSLQVDLAEIALAQAQADQDAIRLDAPFAGIVAAVNLQENTAAPTALPAVTLLDDAGTYVDLSIDEIDIGKIDPGQIVLLTFDAYPGVEVEGVVERIDTLADTTTGIVAYPVRVRVTDPKGARIREGMTVSAKVRIGEKEDVVLIPNWAIRTDQTTEAVFTYCYCIEDGEPKRVAIEIGDRNDNYTEVVSGIEPGTTIALVAESPDLLQFQGPPSQGFD